MSNTVAVVTSGETSDDRPDGGSSSDDDDDESEFLYAGPDELYDDQADAQDEAYVDQHLLVGRPQRKKQPPPQQASQQQQQQQQQQKQQQQSRQHHQKQQKQQPQQQQQQHQTDAILSCPCCFRTVCMDCQRHERYQHQFRAMFVMNIVVHWDRGTVYDRAAGGLVDLSSSSISNNDTVYYTVCCAHCDTVVASLDMTDEVYHFSGCLESLSS